MPEKPRNKIPAPDPATDIFLCRYPPVPNSSVIPEAECTRLYAHPVPGGTPIFYLTYRLEASDPLLIRRFDTTTDAAAFILGLAGSGLAGIPEQQQQRIRDCLPGWFQGGNADRRDPCARADTDPGESGAGT